MYQAAWTPPSNECEPLTMWISGASQEERDAYSSQARERNKTVREIKKAQSKAQRGPEAGDGGVREMCRTCTREFTAVNSEADIVRAFADHLQFIFRYVHFLFSSFD